MADTTTTNSGGPADSRPSHAIGYLRVSTSGQAEHGLGLEAQRKAVRDFARSEGFELVQVDQEAASGAAREGELFSLEHRPVLLGLVDRAEAGTYDVLVVASLDRLSRDQVEQLYLKRLLARFGVTVVSAAGETNGNGDAIGELIERLIGAVHDFDRKRQLERMRAGKAQARERGRHVHGRIPFGYVSAGGGRLEVDEPQAAIARRIFAEAKAGAGPAVIARSLNDSGEPGPQGGRWSRQVVTGIIRNPVYAGEKYGVKGAQPAIVPRRLWNAANR
jgi:site-specific DNA recombinase